MAQAGLHGMVGMAVQKMAGKKEWLLLGVLLGNFIPDMDNVGVAVATLTKMPTEGIHRTMTHSVFFVIVVTALFYIIGQWKKDLKWVNLGIGLGVGLLMHDLLDFALWFNGVNILWPLGGEINFWANSSPPAWFMKFMDPLELLMFGLYLWVLGSWAKKLNTDGDFLKIQRFWMWLEIGLFVLFTFLAFTMTKGFLTIFGAVYLFSLFMTFFVTIRMRKTIAAA